MNAWFKESWGPIYTQKTLNMALETLEISFNLVSHSALLEGWVLSSPEFKTQVTLSLAIRKFLKLPQTEVCLFVYK